MPIDQALLKQAAHIVEMHEHVSAAWHQTWLAFYTKWELTAERAKLGDARAIESAITYLETAPRCHGSGYIAELLMRGLSHAPLSPKQVARLQAVVVAEASRRQSRGFLYVGAVAGAVWDDSLATSLEQITARVGVEEFRARHIAEAARRWGVAVGRSHVE